MATAGAEIQVENGNYSRSHNAILEAILEGIGAKTWST